MKLIALTAVILPLALPAFALDGQVQIHDPSTIVRCDGKFYTYGTGGTALVSDDGWTWIRGAAPSRRRMVPDIIHLGDRYCLYVARNIGAQPRADINLIWSRSLDTNSPDYKWEEAGVVAASDGVEDCNAIDPGVLLDPTDGRLWLVYGSYFGYIRLVELAVQGVPVGGARPRRGGPPGAEGFAGPGGPAASAPGGTPGGGIFGGTGRGPIPPQDVTQVSTNWPAGNVDVRLANYLDQAQQKWAITAVTNAGGYPGSPYFKITIAGTDRVLAATEDAELVTFPDFTGGPEQLWRIEQLTDGTFRILTKVVPKTKESLALSTIGSSFATLAKFNPDSDKQRWHFAR